MNDWIIENSNPASQNLISSECGPYYMVGGFNIFGVGAILQKHYVNLLPHYKIQNHFDFYKMDTWDSEFFNFTVDTFVLVHQNHGGCDYYPIVQNFCGQFYCDDIFTIHNISIHSSRNLSLEFSSNLNSDPYDESWGINNFQLSLFLCHATCLTCDDMNDDNCLTCYDNALLDATTNKCQCLDSYYMNQYSSLCESFPCSQCLECSVGCSLCSDANICDKCMDGYYLNEYQDNCPHLRCSNCIQCLTGCLLCENEISCNLCEDSYFVLDSNSSCLSECPINTILFNKTCYNQCPNDLVWDGRTCVSNCTNYLLIDNKTCVYECPKDYYMFMNICYLICPFPLIGNNGLCVPNSIQFCLNKYSFNDACIKSCPNGYYPNETLKICLLCNENCHSCFGPDENQCSSCTSYYIITFHVCVTNCPDNYFANNQSKICSSCSLNCKLCQNSLLCIECNNNSILINNTCKILKETKGQLVSLNNPFSFKFSLSEEWDYFFNNYNNFIKSVSILNLERKNYNIITYYNESESNVINFIFNYYQILKIDQCFLNIFIYGNDEISYQDKYIYINQNFSTLLNNLSIICNENEYYSKSIL